MSEFARMRPMMGVNDVSAQYAGLEQRVHGIEGTVKGLTELVGNENRQIRREMAEQNQSLRIEAGQHHQGILTALEKLTQTAATSNATLRTEFAAEIKSVSDKQGIKGNTLIAACILGLGALTYFQGQSTKPTENAINELKISQAQSVSDMKSAIARHEMEFVPKAQIERMQVQIDHHEKEIVTREEHDRERAAMDKAADRELVLRDKINALQDKISDQVRTRTIERLDAQDNRLRSVEQKTAK